MQIPIIDESDRQNNLKFIEGFKTGRNNTVANIVNAHESGQSLKSIYKVIKKIYKTEVNNANINH